MKNAQEILVSLTLISGISLLVPGCALHSNSNHAEPPPITPAPNAAPSEATPPPTTTPPPAIVHTVMDVGLEAPEAVIYDEEEDVYLVSSVAGEPLKKDRNGFISKLSPEGKLLELKWIDGAKGSTTLDAPKGMALKGPYLYVADITWIRIFDRKTGEAKGKVFVKGATFLNDVSVSTEQDVIFSDTGWKTGAQGLESTGTDAVFRIEPTSVSAEEIIKSKDLGSPNGLAVTKEGTWVVNARGELFLLGEGGKKERVTQLDKGGLDGVVALPNGEFLISSWPAQGIYKGKPGEKFELLLSAIESPACIGYDSKRNRLLIPQMKKNTVLVVELSPGGKKPTSPSPAPTQTEVKESKPDKKAEAPSPTQKTSEKKAPTAPGASAEPDKKETPAAPASPPHPSASPPEKEVGAADKSGG